MIFISTIEKVFIFILLIVAIFVSFFLLDIYCMHIGAGTVIAEDVLAAIKTSSKIENNDPTYIQEERKKYTGLADEIVSDEINDISHIFLDVDEVVVTRELIEKGNYKIKLDSYASENDVVSSMGEFGEHWDDLGVDVLYIDTYPINRMREAYVMLKVRGDNSVLYFGNKIN